MEAHQAPPSLGFFKQEHWSGLPFLSPMHESEKWKWSRSVVSDSSRPHWLQPTRLLSPWDFPGKSAGVGCYCLLQWPFLDRHYLFELTFIGVCVSHSVMSDSLWPHLSVEFPRKEYSTELPFLTLGDLANPGIKPMSFVSPALAGGFITTISP